MELIRKSLTSAIGVYCLLIIALTILRPAYINSLDKDLTLRFTATSTKNSEALADNIRINHVTINGVDYDLSTVQTTDGWQYDSANDFLYIYNTNSDASLTVHLNDVHSLSIGMVQEVGSGIVNIYINNKIWKTIDLYEKTEWKDVGYTYETSILVSPEKNATLFVIVVGISWIINTIWMVKKKRYSIVLERLENVAILSGLAICLLMAISLVQYCDIGICFLRFHDQSQSFLKAAVLLFLLIYVVDFLTCRLWIAFGTVSLVAMAGCFTSREKFLNRGMPLLPWDFSMIKEAASVASKYEISLKVTDIIALAVISGLMVLIFFLKKCDKYKLSERIIASAIILAVLPHFIYYAFVCCNVEADDANYRVYQADHYYEERGFISGFLEYCAYLKAAKEPDNYNYSTIKRIEDDVVLEESSDNSSETPTIIAVMSESFWDMERLDTISFQEELLPNFNSLKEESRYGELFTHVLNGGTVVSEFEFLTGFSGEFFPQDYMVYGNFLNKGFSSAVSTLKAQHYQTTAIHPYIASNYNRQAAYENFGFDESLFEEDFNDASYVRGYISDEDVFDKIIEQYKKKKVDGQPQFIFAVTMQNHGGYWENTIYEEEAVDFTTDTYGDVTQQSIKDYTAGLHESDRALGELIERFRNVDDNVIIIYFGDHMSDAGPKDDRLLEQTSWAENELTYDFETHRVPFLVWSNYDDTSDNLGIMEVGELLPEVFDIYSIRDNLFWKYVTNVRDTYLATDRRIVVNSSSYYTDISQMTEEQREVYNTFRLLQYDYIWGKRYADNLWDDGQN